MSRSTNSIQRSIRDEHSTRHTITTRQPRSIYRRIYRSTGQSSTGRQTSVHAPIVTTCTSSHEANSQRRNQNDDNKRSSWWWWWTW